MSNTTDDPGGGGSRYDILSNMEDMDGILPATPEKNQDKEEESENENGNNNKRKSPEIDDLN